MLKEIALEMDKEAKKVRAEKKSKKWFLAMKPLAGLKTTIHVVCANSPFEPTPCSCGWGVSCLPLVINQTPANMAITPAVF